MGYDLVMGKWGGIEVNRNMYIFLATITWMCIVRES